MADNAGVEKINNDQSVEEKDGASSGDSSLKDSLSEKMDTDEQAEEPAAEAEVAAGSTDDVKEKEGGDVTPTIPIMDPIIPQCYCEKARNLGSVELQCSVCLGWYHSKCISCHIGKCIPFMTNYQFTCKNCNQTGMETCTKKQSSFAQICYTTIGNIMQMSETKGEPKVMFSKDKDIIPFIDKNWESLTTQSRRIKQTWHSTVYKTLIKEVDFFTCDESTGDALFGLVNQDLSAVGPLSDVAKISQTQNQTLKQPPVLDNKSRSAKRKAFDGQQVSGSRPKRGNDFSTVAKLPPHGYPVEHPFNKDGYRYILTECDPHAPNRREFDESVDWAGKPIPGYLYRTYLSTHVFLALHDRATQLKVSDDRLSVTGEKGYSMIRASHGVRSGSWYYEVKIIDMPPETAVRLGWSQSLGNLQAPCGYDKFSYSWRSRKGTRFHQSHGKHYSDFFKQGDVLGFYINLPPPNSPDKLLPPTFKDRPLVKFKSHLYFEEKDYVTEAEKALKEASGSQLIMYKNGKNQGVAYTDVFEGIYYPALSIYKNAKVKVNFGPRFKFSPKDVVKFRPFSQAAEQSIIDHTLADMIYHVVNEGEIPDF